MREAIRKFTGILAGREKVFRPGDPITEAEAKEMGLASKPGLSKRQTKSEDE